MFHTSAAYRSTRHLLIAIVTLAAAIPALAWASQDGADLSSRLACFEAQNQRLVARRDDDQRQREALIAGLDALAAVNVRQQTLHTVLQTRLAGAAEASSKAYAEAVAKASVYEARLQAARRCDRVWTILAFLHCGQYADVARLEPHQLPSPPQPDPDLVAATEALAQSQAALDRLKADVAVLDALRMADALAMAQGRAILAALKGHPSAQDAEALTLQAKTLLADRQLEACF